MLMEIGEHFSSACPKKLLKRGRFRNPRLVSPMAASSLATANAFNAILSPPSKLESAINNLSLRSLTFVLLRPANSSSNCLSVLTPSPRVKSRILASTALVMDHSLAGEAPEMEPTIVEVNLGERSYPIYIGSGLLNRPELLQRFSPSLTHHFCDPEVPI